MEIVDELITWFTQPANKIFLWVVIGVVGIIVLLWLLTIIGKFIKLSYHKQFPTDTREANLLALGFQQLTNSSQYWNDPTASLLDKKPAAALQEMWGLYSAEDVRDTVERMSTVRRRRELWQQLLELRARAASDNGGKPPSSRQWIATIKDAGGTGKGEEKQFVDAVAFYEKKFKKVFPADAPVTSFDGYALGQAVAVAVWAVGLKLIERDESQRLIEGVNAIARSEFDSWEAFGRSYVLGRAMHWSDGVADEQRAEQSEEAVTAMQTALDGKRRGPWGLLPWQLPAT